MPSLRRAHRLRDAKNIAILTAWLLGGLSFLGSFFTGAKVDPPLDSTDGLIKLTLGGCLVVGSLLNILAMIQWKKITTSWSLELTGTPLLIGGWSTYTITLLLLDGMPLFPIALGFGFIAACVINMAELLVVMKDTRRNVSETRGYLNANN